jgi:hypothetical protein
VTIVLTSSLFRDQHGRFHVKRFCESLRPNRSASWETSDLASRMTFCECLVRAPQGAELLIGVLHAAPTHHVVRSVLTVTYGSSAWDWVDRDELNRHARSMLSSGIELVAKAVAAALLRIDEGLGGDLHWVETHPPSHLGFSNDLVRALSVRAHPRRGALLLVHELTAAFLKSLDLLHRRWRVTGSAERAREAHETTSTLLSENPDLSVKEAFEVSCALA